MIYEENIKELKKAMKINENKGSGKHYINNATLFLPFRSREPERPKFKRKFIGVTGEVARLINSKKLVQDFDIEICVSKILEQVNCSNEEDKKYLKELIKDYLIDKNGDIKIFHANIFNYIQLTEGSESNGERDIARFLYDILFSNNNDISCIFKDVDKNMISKLILYKLEGLEDNDNKTKYINKLSFISNLAKEDFNFMLKNKEFFLKNFSNLLAFYYFYYITQLSIKMNKKFSDDVDYNKNEEVYYLLDWEKASKNRRSETKGYQYIKAESINLLVNMNLIEHLNFLFGVRNLNFIEIKELYNNSTEEEKINYLETIQKWILIYRDNYMLEEIDLELEFNNLISTLSNSLLEKIDQSTMSRYALSIEEIGKKYFLKWRGGKYKFMLNLTQEMMLLLTAVCIKQDKITLKSLFKEYEKRGIYLDQYSKELAIELLVKLNLVDKKSDSGDAQYVKAIL